VTAEHQHHRHDHHGVSANSAIDPVCGMTIDPQGAKNRADHGGRTYYFCCTGCRTKFVADPQKYLGGRQPESVPEGTVYTCPMHPEIRQIGPGA
jgi:Cu+-exporting ATPase